MLPSTTPETASLVQEWPRKWGTGNRVGVRGLYGFLTRANRLHYTATAKLLHRAGPRTKSHLCRDNRAPCASSLGRDLHLSVETGGPPDNRGLGRVQAGDVPEAARTRRLPTAPDQRRRSSPRCRRSALSYRTRQEIIIGFCQSFSQRNLGLPAHS
jgi:hypothetical protein